jgi:hypothetical protein
MPPNPITPTSPSVDLTPINNQLNELKTSQNATNTSVGDINTKLNELSDAQKTDVANRVKMGEDINKAINDVQTGLTSTINNNQAQNQKQFDEFGRLITSNQAQNQQQFDKFGNQINANQAQNQEQFDKFGNLINANQAQNQQQFDKFGNLINANQAQNQNQFDKFGNLINANQAQNLDAISGLNTGLTNLGNTVNTGLSNAYAGNTANTKAIGDLSATVGQNQQTTNEALKGLSDDQKAQVASQVAMGASLAAAIGNVQLGLTNTINANQTANQNAIAGLNAGIKNMSNSLSDKSPDFTPHVTKGSQIKLVGMPNFSENMIPTSQTPTFNHDTLLQIENAAQGGIMHYASGGGTSHDTELPKSSVTKGSSISLVNIPEFINSLIPLTEHKPTPLEVIQNAAEGGLMGYSEGGLMGYSEGGEDGAPVSFHPQLTRGNAKFLQGLMSSIPRAKVGMTPFQSHKEGHSVQDENGNVIQHNPEFYSEGGLKHTYVIGDGDGTSDSIPAMLANGEFVIPADVVSGLGNGSNDAGAKVLDNFLKVVRHHKRNVDVEDLPPDSKGALGYLVEAKKKEKVT